MERGTARSAGGDRRLAEALADLQRVTDSALAYLSFDDLLRELLERVAAVLATDTAAILLLDDERKVLHARAAKGIEEEVERGVQIPVGRGFAGRIAAERRAIAIDDVDQADILNPILREKGIRSLLGVPLLVEGEVIGVLHVGSLTPRGFHAHEHEVLQLAADRLALAIDHARLYHSERAARERAERTARMLAAIQRVTDAALAYLSLDDLLRELLERVSDILHSDTAAILLLDADRGELIARAAKGIEEEVEQGVRIPLGGGFAGRIAAERRPIAIEDVDHADILNPILRRKGIRSLLGVPLLVQGRVTGVLHVGTLTQRVFTDEERDLLQLAGDRVALAIEHAQLYAQRGAAEAFQRVLLPDRLPEMPGFELAAAYLPAAVGASVGGDWYDVFTLHGGAVGLAIGDVVGRGIGAAALMAQLRIALRAYALEDHPPREVLQRLNRLLEDFPPPRMTTVAYLVLDPIRESLVVANAGHLPPLLRPPDGAAFYLPVEGDIPLGVSRAVAYREHRFDIPAGTGVTLVTDGAVEVPGEPLEAGLARLRRLADGIDAPAPLCRAIASGAAGQARRDDDLAVLCVRLTALPDRLVTTWPADATVLNAMRHTLQRWLHKWGAGEDEVYDITVAVQEACANAIEHAYAPGEATFELELSCARGTMTAMIRDRGRWREPRGTNRGRGLLIMEALMDSLHVERGEDGNVVTLTRELKRVHA